jgi:predicted nuclease of predicted toxin-antitoxin system
MSAIYVDLENLPSEINLQKIIDGIKSLNKTKKDSETIFGIKIACGNKTSILKLEKKLLDYNFEIINVTKITANYKNRADLIISLDAFETLIVNIPVIDQYIFITKDSDFTVIMDKLRKYKKDVLLVTNNEASKKHIFNNTCSDLLIYDHFMEDQQQKKIAAPAPAQGPAPTPAPVNDNVVDNNANVINNIKKVFESLEYGKWHYNSTIGARFHKADASLHLKDTKFKNISNLISYIKDNNVIKNITIETGKSPTGSPYTRITRKG